MCASAYARELVAPVSLGSMGVWELTVMERTGVAPGQFHMSGYMHLMRALRNFRGDHRVRDPATLYKCEVCPYACAVPLRVRQRRFIGAEGVVSDPPMVMASEAGLAPLVSEVGRCFLACQWTVRRRWRPPWLLFWRGPPQIRRRWIGRSDTLACAMSAWGAPRSNNCSFGQWQQV